MPLIVDICIRVIYKKKIKVVSRVVATIIFRPLGPTGKHFTMAIELNKQIPKNTNQKWISDSLMNGSKEQLKKINNRHNKNMLSLR